MGSVSDVVLEVMLTLGDVSAMVIVFVVMSPSVALVGVASVKVSVDGISSHAVIASGN